MTSRSMNGALALHPSLPRRPDRTSQAEEAPPKDVTFSVVVLGGGVKRVIRGTTRAQRAIQIALEREERSSFILVFPVAGPLVARAVDVAPTLTAGTSVHVGSLQRSRTGLVVDVTARATSQGRPVVAFMRRNERGERRGGIVLSELHELRRAIAWLLDENAADAHVPELDATRGRIIK